MIGCSDSNWLGDTSGWWDRDEDIRERHAREMREKAATAEQWRRASEESEARRLVLDDDGWQVLGNALLLAWSMPDPRSDIYQQRLIYSELTDLWGILDDQGALAQEFQDLDGQTISAFREGLQGLRRGHSAFALLRAKDLCPQPGKELSPEVRHALLISSAAELRSSISRLGRCNLTIFLRDAVLSYFRGANLKGEPSPVADAVGKTINAETQAGRALRNLTAENPDHRLTKAVLESALGQCGFGKNAVDRIWAELGKGASRRAGATPHAMPKFTVEMVRQSLP